MENSADMDSGPRSMSLSFLKQITCNFSQEQLIGKGEYGNVYKGNLEDGTTIAVKKLHVMVGMDDEQFQKEFASLKGIQHQNLVRLIGYCYETRKVLLPDNGRHVIAYETERALCFEYMQNGPLDRHISDIRFGLDWNTRYRIIKGVCEGLEYLHEGWTHPILHLDLKPSNILLDKNMNAKISDFGLSRLFGEGNVRQMGTIEYMAPEFIERQVNSHKSDVYSLGVVLLELLTGRRPESNDVYSSKFVEPVLQKWRERLPKTVYGTSFERLYQQVTKCLEIALKCVEYDRHERPSIGEIVNRLNEIETLMTEEVRTIQNRFDSRKYMLLDIDPLELYFPFMLRGRKKDISSCSLQLKNRGDDGVAFMLVANIPKRYLTKKSICGVVLPRSSKTLALTMLKQTPPTSSDSSDFFTLYSAMVGQYDLLDVDKDYTFKNFFKKSMEYGDKVQVVKLKVICDRPAAKSTGTSPEAETTIQHEANEQRAELESKLLHTNSLMEDLQQLQGELEREKDHAVRQAEEMRQISGNTVFGSTGAVALTEFSYEEIKEATNDFDDSKKIGQGGCGSVYKGFLRHTTVAIKKINRQGATGEKEFNDEVETLRRMRHPNLGTLIGVCREAKALVFELLSNGSLGDCMRQRVPLSWRMRIRIAADICTGLIFLHSNKPKGIAHGDLKPDNVLLDTSFACKLADFGISRPLNLTNTTVTPYHRTNQIEGTMGYCDPVYLASGELTAKCDVGTMGYCDPVYLASGKLTAKCDVYSFGVALLELLTGKSPLGLPNEVEAALSNDRLKDIIDTSAGEWPPEYTEELARLALRCCRYDRKERPDLAKEAWSVLQAMMNSPDDKRQPPTFSSAQ